MQLLQKMHIIDMLLIFLFMIEFAIRYGLLQIYFDYHTGINTSPVITNLPLASPISIPENSALSASVFQVSVSDVNAGDTHTYTASYNPGLGSTLFSFNAASEYMYNFSKGLNARTHFRVY